MKTKQSVLAAAALLGLGACASQSGSLTLPDVGFPSAERAAAVRAARAPEAANGAIQAVPMPAKALNMSASLSRIVIASCTQQNEDQSMWDQLTAENPDLTLYIGDNVYGDVRSNDPALPELKAAYMRLAGSAPFARLRAAAPMLTTWDDHDYGLNDAGKNFAYREDSQKLFNYVWDVPANSARRQRPGIYDSWIIGDEGERVQIIMLDTRYFRDDLKDTDERFAPGKERYVPDPDPAKTMLGEAQWAWLEAELEKPADLRLLVSSIQLIADGHGWEAWRTLPTEQTRLYELAKKTGTDNLVVLSGDRHSAALYRRDLGDGASLFELTSSSINLPASVWRAEREETRIEDGPYRLGTMIYEANYGVLDIDWDAGTLTASINGEDGAAYLSETIAFRK